MDEAFKTGNEKTVTTIVKFSSSASVRAIFRKGVLQKLKGSKVEIRPDLPPEIREARRPWYPTLNKLKREGRQVYFQGSKLFCDGEVVKKILVSAERDAGSSTSKTKKGTSVASRKEKEEDEDFEA